MVIVEGRINGVFGGAVGEIYRKFLADFKAWYFEGYTRDVVPKVDIIP